MWKKYLLGAVISLAALYFFFSTVTLGDLTQALGHMNPWWLIPSTLLLAGAFGLRAVRWHFLMRPVARVGLRSLFAALMVGFLANNILPAHLGEVVRAMVLGREEKVSTSATLATVVLERVYDGLAVVLLLLLVLLFLDRPGAAVEGAITLDGLRTAGWVGLAFFLGVLVVLQAFCFWRGPSLKVLGWCCRPLPAKLSGPIMSFAGSFADGLAVARATDLMWIAVYSMVIWGVYGLWAWSLLPAFGLNLGFWAGALVEVVVALALIIPAAPGFVGTFHIAASSALLFFGVDATVAASYAMVLWLLHFVFTSLVGLYYFWRLGLGWGDLTGAKKQA